MILSNKEELISYLLSIFCGIVCSLVFDAVMSIKRDKGFAFYLFLWAVLAVVFWVLWQKFFYGNFIWYTIAGFVSSIILYFFSLHKPVYFAFCFVRDRIYGFFYFIYKILLTEKGFLSKIMVYVRRIFLGNRNIEGKNYEKTKNKD